MLNQKGLVSYLVIEEVLSYLSPDRLQLLRLVSREFNGIAMPLLIRFHATKDFDDPHYISFIEKFGKFVRVLRTTGHAFCQFNDAGLELSEIFSGLRYIALHGLVFDSDEYVELFVLDCLPMVSLRSITVLDTY